MSAILALLATSVGKYILMALAAVIAVGGAMWRSYAAGKKSERAKQAEQETAARDIRDQVQNDIGAMPADKVREELAKRAAK